MLSYTIVRNPKGGPRVIILTCPKCGREGRLRRHGTRTYGFLFQVRHIRESGSETCNITWHDDCYDEIQRIYDEVRNGGLIHGA